MILAEPWSSTNDFGGSRGGVLFEHALTSASRMILCLFPRHDQANKGALRVDQPWAAKSNPYNTERGNVQSALTVNQDYCAIAAGTVKEMQSCQSIGTGMLACVLRCGGKA